MKVIDIIKTNNFCLSYDDTIAYATSEFVRRGLAETPIIKGDEVIGILSSENLLAYISAGKGLSAPVKEIMEPKICKTKLNTELNDISDIPFDT